MKICGIEIKGSEAIIAVASLDGQALSHVALATRKIALDEDDEAANVKVFAAQVASFVRENSSTGSRSRSAARKANSPVGRLRSRLRGFSSCWKIAR
jgi:Protein of unknown function (DUF3010).